MIDFYVLNEISNFSKNLKFVKSKCFDDFFFKSNPGKLCNRCLTENNRN